MFQDDDVSIETPVMNEYQVNLLRQADPEAWRVTLEAYRMQLRDDIISSLQRRHLSHDLVDDIEQATWTTAARRIKSFEWRGEDSFYHWLRVISFNYVRRAYAVSLRIREVSFDHLEADETIDVSALDENIGSSHDGDSVEGEVVRREQAGLVQTALAKLTPKEADILWLWITGESRQEIATRYGVSPGAVSMIIHRATKKLRPFLEPLE
jgi:RNA polymerase sigma factor (sigma-70 family)